MYAWSKHSETHCMAAMPRYSKCTYAHAYIHISIYVYTYVHKRINIHMRACIYIYECMYLCLEQTLGITLHGIDGSRLEVYTFIYINIYVYIYIHKYTHIHIYVYIYIYTYIPGASTRKYIAWQQWCVTRFSCRHPSGAWRGWVGRAVLVTR